jgi:hypothetical protein
MEAKAQFASLRDDRPDLVEEVARRSRIQTAVQLLASLIEDRTFLLPHLAACGVDGPGNDEVVRLQSLTGSVRRRMLAHKVVGTILLNGGLVMLIAGMLAPVLFSVLLGMERSFFTGAVQSIVVVLGGLAVRQYLKSRQTQADAEGIMRRTLFIPEPMGTKLRRVEAFHATGKDPDAVDGSVDRAKWRQARPVLGLRDTPALQRGLGPALDHPMTGEQALAFATQFKEVHIKLLACAFVITLAIIGMILAVGISVAFPYLSPFVGINMSSTQTTLLQTLLGGGVTGILAKIRQQYVAKRKVLRHAIVSCVTVREPFAQKMTRLTNAVAQISGGMVVE